jgi:hypothetical protein
MLPTAGDAPAASWDIVRDIGSSQEEMVPRDRRNPRRVFSRTPGLRSWFTPSTDSEKDSDDWCFSRRVGTSRSGATAEQSPSASNDRPLHIRRGRGRPRSLVAPHRNRLNLSLIQYSSTPPPGGSNRRSASPGIGDSRTRRSENPRTPPSTSTHCPGIRHAKEYEPLSNPLPNSNHVHGKSD